MAAPPAPHERDKGNTGVEVCLFDESPEDFSSAVRAISELAAGDPEPSFPDAEVGRLASSITFLREWRFFSYEPKGVSFTHGARSTSSRDDTQEITLPQFSSASVPQAQVTHLEDGRNNNTDSSDFILFAGGNVWSLDWCPRLCDKPCSSVNCEYLAVAAHPPGSSYHKIGMPLIGRGIIQVWCLVAPFEEAHTDQSMAAYTKSNRRGRPRKIPDVSNSIDSSVPQKPIGRPRKIKLTTSDDHAEPILKKPRGRPRKYPLSVAKVLDSTDNSASQDHSFIDPLVTSGVIPGDLALSCAIPTVKPGESTPKKGRGRPRKIPKCSPAIELKDMSRALVCIEPKKKKGRPRKYPPRISSKHVLGTIPESGSETACLAVSACNSGHNGAEQNNLTTPKRSDNVASVDNCKKQIIVYTRRRVRQPTKKCDSSETFSLACSGDIQKMERSSTSIMPNNHLSAVEKPKQLGSSISKDMANAADLAGCKSAVVNCEVMEMNDSEAPNQIVAVPFGNSAQIIDELEDTEIAPVKESSNNSNIITCEENLHVSAIPNGIRLPRVVLCLAHNGKVAWDIKWKPPLPNQSEQKSSLGFLAILLGNGSLEVWEVPSPSMIQKIYSSSSMDGTDPRFLKLRPVFRCAKVKCGNRQSIPLTVDWSPSPHDMILAGCHDGTVALWKFSTDLSSQDSKPFMCVTAESVPIRALSWAPYVSEENTNTFVTAGEDGLKFWDLRDPYRPLWELSTAPRAVLSLHWLKDARGIVISLEDGTLKFLSLYRIANDVPVTGRPFAGTKTQGVSTYQLSEHLIWNVHVSETTGYAAYCGADGTAVRFQLTSRFWEKEPGRNRVPYFLCGSLAEEGTVIKVGGVLQHSPLPNVPLVAKKGPKAQDIQKEKLQTITNSEYVDPELREGQQESKALVLVDPQIQESGGICNGTVNECPQNVEVFPPKSVALHRLRWNMNKGSEKWLCYGGASGIIRCQRI